MDSNECLINAVRDFPCLYNSKSADFKIQLKKENAWAAVANIGQAVDDCQARWKTLRERYVRELRKKKSANASGNAATSCVPWELQSSMEFIKDFVKHRRYEGNMELPQPDVQDDSESLEQLQDDAHLDQDIFSDVPSPNTSMVSSDQAVPKRPSSPLSHQKKKKKKVNPVSADIIDLEILKELKRTEKKEVKADEDDLFGQSIEASLKKLTPQQKGQAKILIL